MVSGRELSQTGRLWWNAQKKGVVRVRKRRKKEEEESGTQRQLKIEAASCRIWKQFWRGKVEDLGGR